MAADTASIEFGNSSHTSAQGPRNKTLKCKERSASCPNEPAGRGDKRKPGTQTDKTRASGSQNSTRERAASAASIRCSEAANGATGAAFMVWQSPVRFRQR